MALLAASEPSFVTAEGAAQRRGYASKSELALRNAMESFMRERRPQARMCHELVMGARTVRADLVAVDLTHIAAVEVKGEYDDTTRLLHQVGMYQLCVPEVWMIVPDKHSGDAELIHHLLPSVGLIVGEGLNGRHSEKEGHQLTLAVRHEAVPRAVVPKMMLEMLWAAELVSVCHRTRTGVGKKPTRPQMIRALVDLPIETLQTEVCIELRSRDALWRADAPLKAVS